MRTFRIPLQPVSQRFTILLNGKSYDMTSRWNGENPAWELSMTDTVTQVPLFTCLPIVTGADLLEQFRHLMIGGHFVAFTDGDAFSPPNETNLGAESNLYYLIEN